jgi:hypothetical protein
MTVRCARCDTPFVPAERLIPRFTVPPSIPQQAAVYPDTTSQGKAPPFVRPTLAVLGVLLLIVGQFCPMLTLSNGDSINFFNYSLKTGWLMTKAAAAALDKGADNRPQPRPLTRSPEKSYDASEVKQKPSDSLRAAALLVGFVLTVLSPFSPLLMVALAVLSLWGIVRELGWTGNRRRSGTLTFSGVFCLLAILVLYAGPMLVLWAIPDLLSFLALVVSSFSFGWGVLLGGSILLVMAGLIR